MDWQKLTRKILIILVFPLPLYSFFDSKECLHSSFDLTVERPGAFLGLFKNYLRVSKKDCSLEMELKKIFPKKWIVDLCRAPVHLKYTSTGTVEFQTKAKPCHGQSQDTYCKEMANFFEVLSSNGLIFAKGSRENLQDDHGKIYCSYLLTKKYLEEDHLFSLSKSIDLFSLGGVQTPPAVSALVEPPKDVPAPTTGEEDPLELDPATLPPPQVEEESGEKEDQGPF